MRIWSFAVLTALLSSAPALAAPRLNWMLPCGGRRGTTFRATVGGAGLEALTGVVTTGPGVTAKILPPVPGKDAKAERAVEVTVSADAPLGQNELRIYDHSGASNPKFFWVGQYPEILETEPNDGRSKAQHVELPVTVNGQIDHGSDIDSFTFHLRKGQEMTAEIQSLRLLGELGNTWLKGYAWAEDSRGNILAENDGYYRWDPYLQFTAPDDGEYTVSYRDIEYRGNPMGVYRLTLGVIPHVWSCFPMGGQRGTTTTVRLFGCNLGASATREIRIPADASEGMQTEWFEASGLLTNHQQFAVSHYPSILEKEPNDDPKSANRVPFPAEIQGILEKPGDVDSFVFSGKKGQRVVLEVLSRRAEKPIDSVLTLRRADGTLLTENDDARDRDSRIDRTLDADGDYIVQVRDQDFRGGPDFVYQLSLSPLRPDFSLQAQQDKPLLKPGGNVTLDLKVTRTDGFDGDITVTVEGLPAGVTADALTVPKGKEGGKLTLHCAAGTPYQPAVLRIWGEAAITGTKERRLGTTTETYNIQGTAYHRDLTGPVLVVGGP